MAEQEEKQGEILSEAALREAIQSLKGKPQPADTEDPFSWDMKPLPGIFGKHSKSSK